ncbi:MAG: acylphosphatase [Patescibacteria group bacterium]
MNSLIHVYGRVQGVFFRATVQKKAKSLGLTGSVQNCSNGSVEIIASGGKKQLETFVGWILSSPGASKVQLVENKILVHCRRFDSFEVIH